MMHIHRVFEWLAATPAPAVDDAQQQFRELFLQVGLALIVMSLAAAYLTARKKKEARAEAAAAKLAESQKVASAKTASAAKSKSAKAKAARASASAKKDRA